MVGEAVIGYDDKDSRPVRHAAPLVCGRAGPDGPGDTIGAGLDLGAKESSIMSVSLSSNLHGLIASRIELSGQFQMNYARMVDGSEEAEGVL